jgi:hypothetical protein
MRPADQPNAIDPHEPIDLSNAAKVDEITKKLECSEDELAAAVDKVGDHPVAIALYLNRPQLV